MKKLTQIGAFVAMACAGVWVTGCESSTTKSVRGHGVGIEKSYPTAAFDEVSLAVPGEMDVKVGAEEAASVMVVASQAVLDVLVVEVDDGELTIKAKEGFAISGPVKIRVTTPKLVGIDVLGSGEVMASGISADEFEIEVAGSGEVEASGVVRSLEVSVAGSGEVELFELKADEVDVEIAGSAEVEVYAAKSLSVEIAGSGEVSYKGDPQKIDKEIAGSGTVEKEE